MSRRRLTPGATAALLGLPVAFISYFFVYPLTAIFWRGLTATGTLSFDPFLDVLTSPSLRGVAWFTVWQALVSTLLTLAVGMPTAYVFARFRFRGRALLRGLSIVPFVLPTLVVGTAFLTLIGPNGALGIDLRGTVWAILIAHVFYNYAIVVRGVGSFWEQIDPRLEEAARVLGASPWRTFTRVTFPLLRPAVLASASLIFLLSFTSFGVVLILGDLAHTTLEVEIWRQTTAFLRLDVAAALAVLQLVGVGVLLVVYGRTSARRSRELPLQAGDTARPPRTRGQRLFVWTTVTFMMLFLGIPIAVLVVRSLRPAGGFGIDNYVGLFTATDSAFFVTAPEAMTNSLLFAFAALVIAVVIGVLAAVSSAYSSSRIAAMIDSGLMLPLGASAVTIGFGFLVALDEPIDLRTSIMLIPIAHALVAIPFVIRTSLPVMRSVQQRLRDAAAVLGAGPLRVWREVDLPIVARAIGVGAAFAFAISLGEFGATAFIVRPGNATMPVAIFRLLSLPGATNFGRAMALSVILMVLTGASVMFIDRLRRGTGGDI